MPNLHSISPSSQSQQPLSMPITVINRHLDKNNHVAKHSHNWGQLIYACEGVMLVSTATERYIIPPEQAVWIVAGVVHDVVAITPVHLISFYFDEQQSTLLSKQSGVLQINQFLKTLIREASSIGSDYLWSGPDGLLLRLILNRLTSAAPVTLQLPFPTDPKLLKILFMQQQQPGLKYDLTTWGRIVGASSRTLSRSFKRQTGLTYNQWRQRLTVHVAISQMAEGQSIANIASTLGYESISAFGHMFKQNTHMTPGEYRDRIGRGADSNNLTHALK